MHLVENVNTLTRRVSVYSNVSEVSEKQEVKKAPVIYEIINSQLALWTLVFSFLYSYAWKQHRKKFLMSMVFVVPTVMIVLCTISSLLTVIVILGRIFSTPIKIDDMLKFGHNEEDDQAYPRRRSLSGTSCRSSLSGRSSSTDELLPKPFCRKHSMSNGSLNQLTFGSQNFGSNGAISGISSGSSNGSTNRSPTYLTNGRKFSYNSYTPIETHDETANTPKSAI
uniref:Uncharacterized protein n=1 Tax=Acrobeloides nanus TaxID=290746 RepID=A0A914CG14_9BILA